MKINFNQGIYILLIKIDTNKVIKIGKLGKIKFNKGLYAYIGSAQKNLDKRILRHYKKDKKLFWHIDYLLKYGKIIRVYIANKPKSYEEEIAKELCEFLRYIKGFGSSDTNAKSHLFIVNKNFFKIIKEYNFKKIKIGGGAGI